MQKIALSLTMLFFSHASFAGWIHIAHGGNTIMYGDPSSIETSGYKVRMLVLIDWASSKKSDVYFREFDCKKGLSSDLGGAHFSENMGRGEPDSIGKYDSEEGTKSTPNSLGGKTHEFACKLANFNF